MLHFALFEKMTVGSKELGCIDVGIPVGDPLLGNTQIAAVAERVWLIRIGEVRVFVEVLYRRPTRDPM